jgi:hypothetical protein
MWRSVVALPGPPAEFGQLIADETEKYSYAALDIKVFL